MFRRRENLLVEQIDGEVVAYEGATHRFHLLAPPAAALFDAASLPGDFPDLVRRAAGASGLELAADEAEAALEQLVAAGLLRDDSVEAGPDVSRRAAVRRLGAIALATPLVTSFLAPSALAAQSGQVMVTPEPSSPPSPLSGGGWGRGRGRGGR